MSCSEYCREELKMAKPKKQRDLVYILAPSYTGSTLLTFLLSRHEDIATIGELKATARANLDEYLCSCGVLQRECEFWKSVADKMQRAGTNFALEDFGTHFRADSLLCDRLLRAGIRSKYFEAIRDSFLRLLPNCRRQLHDILERNRQLIDIICELQKAEIYLDGSKDAIRLRLLNSAGHWNLKVIYLIRDGRGTCNSYMRHYNVSMDIAAREWYRTHGECDRVVRELGDEKVIKIHYEYLCKSTKETLEKICNFLGIDGKLSNLKSKPAEHHILGNQMRLRSTDEIRLDEKWKKALTKEDLAVFEQIAGKYQQLYGYS